MKKIILSTFLLLALLSTTYTTFAQANKSQLIKEVNELFTACKQWDYEGIVLDAEGSFKYHICLTADCNPFVSWDFYIKNLKSIELGKMDDYNVINFICTDKDCIIPTGYTPGGRYDKKSDLFFIIKDVKKAKELVAKLNELKQMEFGK